MFQNVPSGWYSLRVTATSDMEEEKVIWKMYVPITSSICSVNLINAGLVVDGASVSMEFRGWGLHLVLSADWTIGGLATVSCALSFHESRLKLFVYLCCVDETLHRY